MTETEEFEREMQEAASRRELDRALRETASRDGEPLRFRRALRFIAFFLLLDQCHEGAPGAARMMQAFLRSGPPPVPAKRPQGRTRVGARRRLARGRGAPLRASRPRTR